MKTINVNGKDYISTVCANCPYYIKTDNDSINKIGICKIDKDTDPFSEIFNYDKPKIIYVCDDTEKSLYPEWCECPSPILIKNENFGLSVQNEIDSLEIWKKGEQPTKKARAGMWLVKKVITNGTRTPKLITDLKVTFGIQRKKNDTEYIYVCSEYGFWSSTKSYNYCPSCGAAMKENYYTIEELKKKLDDEKENYK